MPTNKYDHPPPKIDYATQVNWPLLNDRRRAKVWRDFEAESSTETDDVNMTYVWTIAARSETRFCGVYYMSSRESRLSERRFSALFPLRKYVVFQIVVQAKSANLNVY